MTTTTEHPDSTSTGRTVLEASGLKKTYRMGSVPVQVLKDASIEVRDGEWLAILGASGSGKSTLLHLLGGLDLPDPDGGVVSHRGRTVSSLRGAGLNRYRNRDIGFVFQFYHLLPELSVLENAMLPCMVPPSRMRASLPLVSAAAGATIGAIVRGEDVIIAHHDTMIQEFDHVILFVPDKRQIPVIESLFQVSATFV